MHRYDTKFLKIFGEFFGNTAKEKSKENQFKRNLMYYDQ